MRGMIFLLLLATLGSAFMVEPYINDYQDTGHESLPAMNVEMKINCDTKQITVTATDNETGQKIPGAKIYLFYTDYGYHLISSGATGTDGTGVIDVTGNLEFLSDLFIIKIEESAHKSREIEFTYWNCFNEQPESEEQPAPEPEEEAEEAVPDEISEGTEPAPELPPAEEQPLPAEETADETIALPPEEEAEAPEPPGTLPCGLPAVLIGAILLIGIAKH